MLEDIDEIQTDSDHPCYFAMFDISGLAAINMQFGNDAGDTVLCNTANILTEAFPDGTVYRTGDDEFVVAIRKDDNSPAAYNQVIRAVTAVQSELFKTQEIPDAAIQVGYKVTLVRTTAELSTTVVAVLKDMANRGGRTPLGQINFLDLDAM